MSITKKIFIISTTLLVAALFFWGIYNFAFKSNSGGTAKSDTNKTPAQSSSTLVKVDIPAVEKEKIYPISEEAVLAPFLRENTETIAYYSFYDGSASEISLEGQNKKVLSSTKLPGLKNIEWSPDGNKVISYFNNNGQSTFFLFDYLTKSGKQLAEGMDNIVWTNLGDKIIYKFSDAKNGKSSLSIANSDGSNWKNIDSINFKNMKIAPVPATSLISFWNFPNAFEETQLKTIPLVGGESKVIFSGKFGTDYLWSPNGEKALVSFSDQKGGTDMSLAVINNQGGEFQNLGIPAMVSKCVWSKDGRTVYYALPGGISAGSVMPNDYQDGKVTTQDTFWSVDVATGKKNRIVELDKMKEMYDAANLFLSTENSAIFFVNRIDKKLYRINL
jgi:Tol biopolymer transport system component